MQGTHKEYNMAVALLNFRKSYKELVRCSKQLPDLDVTEGYPWFLLDFEEIEPAVLNWCSTHASKLLDACPDIVDNPACLDCPKFGIGLGSDGLCKGATDVKCSVYPKIMFNRHAVLPVLVRAGVYKTELSDEDCYLLYQQEVIKSGKKVQGV